MEERESLQEVIWGGEYPRDTRVRAWLFPLAYVLTLQLQGFKGPDKGLGDHPGHSPASVLQMQNLTPQKGAVTFPSLPGSEVPEIRLE